MEDPDILEQILKRLDVKDLIRYKSVCKSWKYLISESRFINAHLNHSFNNNNEVGRRRIVLSRYPLYTPDIYEVDDDFFEFYDWRLLGSSNGLVCTFLFNGRILIANPSTREVKTLQRPQVPEMRTSCWGFGYDSSIDDYKIIIGFRKGNLTCFQVLTLKSNIWKVIGEVNYSHVSKFGVLCNGALHWVMADTSSQNNKKVILSLHLTEEEFKEIPQPEDSRYESDIATHKSMRLGIMEECLCVFRHEMLPNNIWMMRNYNVKQSWGMVGHECKMKHETIHCFKYLKYYVPRKRSLCNDVRLCRTWEFIGAPIFVQSLVSPHVPVTPKKQKQTEKRQTETCRRSLRLMKKDPSAPGSNPEV